LAGEPVDDFEFVGGYLKTSPAESPVKHTELGG